MVTICNELGLDLNEVMEAKPFWVPEKRNNSLEELLMVAEYENY